MKHRAKLTISRPSYGDNRSKIAISVRDVDARIEFLGIEIDLHSFTEALTGQGNVECAMWVRDLDKVGKAIEKKDLVFEVPTSSDAMYVSQKDALKELPNHVPEGWVASKYFGSKDSLFTEDNKCFARTTISRWLDKK